MTKTFTVVLRTRDDATAIHMLRASLKTLWRRYGMKAIAVTDISTRFSS